jgi:hypothetical protein
MDMLVRIKEHTRVLPDGRTITVKAYTKAIGGLPMTPHKALTPTFMVFLTFETGETVKLEVSQQSYEFLVRARADGLKIREVVKL